VAPPSRQRTRQLEKTDSVSDSDYPGNDALAPKPLPAPAPGVSLWWCPLTAGEETVRALMACLSPEERARVARFGKPILAHRYVLGRAGLRHVLGARLGIAAVDVKIARDARGRPHLDRDATIDFNVTHTGDAAMFGLTERPGVRIGVDLERASRNVDALGLARRVCTPREREALAALDDEPRRLAFLRLWTCKEAASKATGDALGAPFRRIGLALEPDPKLAEGPPPYVPRDWSLYRTDVPEGFIGTVALWSFPVGDA
jgi:4'-phosphopantetheinyl transferase